MTDETNGSTPGSEKGAADNGARAGGAALSAEHFHRFVDRELDAAGKDTLARAAALDPDVQRRIDGLLEVRAVVQEAVLAQSPEIDSDALFKAVEAGIAAGAPAKDETVTTTPATARPALRVLAGGRTDATRVPSADPAIRLRRIGTAVIGIVAIAAVAFLALRGTDEPTVADATPDGETTANPLAARFSGEPARTEVLEVDFGTNIGTIFAIEGDEGDRYAVVWLDEGDAATRSVRPERPAPEGSGAAPD